MQLSQWMNEFDVVDRQSSRWEQDGQSSTDELYGPRVVGKRRCTIQYTHYVANLALLPIYGTLSSTCHANCTRQAPRQWL